MSNETKIGILTVVAVALLIVGFNFLKGHNLFDKSRKLYAVFHSVNGLALSNPVIINGLQIGSVFQMKEQNANLDSVIVTINLTKEVNIPANSIAFINKDLLGTASITIEQGKGTTALVHNGDTLNTQVTTGIIEDVKASLKPALNNVNGTLKSLDSLIEVVGGVFDPSTKGNFQRIIANLTASSMSLQSLLNAQTGMLAKTLHNVSDITGNLAGQNEHINTTIGNLESATSKLAAVNIQQTLTNLDSTVSELHSVVAKVNSPNGSVGLLLNDKKLYNNLENTTRSLNILMDDLRVNPKRYVSISIFGKKNKGNYLTEPLTDSSKTGKP